MGGKRQRRLDARHTRNPRRAIHLDRRCGGWLTRKQLAALIRQRRIRRVLRNVYMSSDIADTLESRVAALRLVVGPLVVVCDRTAAWLHGVDAFRDAELEILPPIDTCVPPDRTRVRRPECGGKIRDLASTDVENVMGLRVTTPLRTALDLGCSLSRRDALAVFDAFLRGGYFDKRALLSEIARFACRRGVVQLREVAPLADPAAEAPSESWTRMAIVDAGLPVPQLQWVVGWRGRELFRLDLAYPKHRVCIGFDGVEFHDSEVARRHDEERRNWLRDHGWTVIVVRKEDFTPEAVARWTQEVREALQERNPSVR